MNEHIHQIRSQFPALRRTINGMHAVYFDGPGGTQTPQRVIDAMVNYLVRSNANTGGLFAATMETDAMILNARKTFADFFHCAPDEVSFGENSTTINFKLSQAIARDLKPGDEIIITDLDHDANRSPWEILQERGIVVRSVAVDLATLTLDMNDYKNKLSSRTKVVAFNGASNAVGTISDAKEIVRLAKSAGAVTVADAVHLALHQVIDVRDMDVDFLFCSAYKFFGPHIGVLYGRREAMRRLRTLKVSAQSDDVPKKFETGTMNHEGIAGAAEAVEFIASLGEKRNGTLHAGETQIDERRKKIVRGMHAVEEYEKPLADYFKQELRKIPGLTLYAPSDPVPCTSTISFRMKDVHPKTIAQHLAEKGIFVWAGGFYAVELMRKLGVAEKGGLLRIGLAPYNTKEEIERTILAIRKVG